MGQCLVLTALGITLLSNAPVNATWFGGIKELSPGWQGSTGLFELALPETLRAGEVSLGFHYSRFHREPGQLRVDQIPISFTLGLHDQIELFLSWESQKWIRANQIQVGKFDSGFNLAPARLSNGILSFFNDLPYIDSYSGKGVGDFWIGLKLGLLSPTGAGDVGFAIQTKTRIPSSSGYQSRLRGLTSGATDLGLDLLFSRQFGPSARLTANGGFLLTGDVIEVDRQHQFDYGLGIDFPVSQEVTFIAELIGTQFQGSSRTSSLANPKAPLDLHFGFRLPSLRWLQFSTAYSLNLSALDPNRLGIYGTGRHGWNVQLVLHRKINRSPTIQCYAEPKRILPDEPVTIRVDATDPDDDFLNISWKATAGTILVHGDSVIFDSTGLAPGIYTISAELSDGENSATCFVDIQIQEQNSIPPPAPHGQLLYPSTQRNSPLVRRTKVE